MDREYEIRSYQRGDEENIIRLLDLVFDGWPKFDLGCSPLEHWRWKYQGNPLKMNQIVVGVSDSLIIGSEHSFSSRIKIGDKVYPGSHSGDVAVDSGFRRTGIYKKMRELKVQMRKKSGVPLFYYVTYNPILIKTLSKSNRRFPYDIMNSFRIHDVDLHISKRSVNHVLMKKYGFQLMKLMNRFRNTLNPSNPSSYDFQILEIATFGDSINVFWEEIKDHYNFILERNRDYLNWRYCDPRGGNYLVKIAKADSKILGYIVLRINRLGEDYPPGYIVDLLTLPNRIDIADALIADAVKYFTTNNVNMVFCLFIKNHPYEAILERNGFVSRGENLSLFYGETTKVEELREIENGSPKRIHFAFGDFDAI